MAKGTSALVIVILQLLENTFNAYVSRTSNENSN